MRTGSLPCLTMFSILSCGSVLTKDYTKTIIKEQVRNGVLKDKLFQLPDFKKNEKFPDKEQF